ncbi:MAG: methylmalonyl-CoA epimerase [Bradyrhizobiaceae bacterium]|nr:methylmalonyl-CoA epimerase [Bradyrhizobiaceae bacterium]
MITNVDHLGIAVADLDKAMDTWGRLLGITEWHREQVADQGVEIASCLIGNVRIELTAATTSSSPIARFIEKRGEGIHHVALRSDSLTDDLQEAADKGFTLIDKSPRHGAHNMMIAFLHPASTGGVLVEYCTPRTDQE